ncbi:MAG: bifunctional adenosylcobinamide kinase/adenosylcobinamide-phosphate guanylyltransferase [Rhodobacterales bacterium]|nr:MAG: bifunctional adenosylcobinamide kinase/adenosylcobinamide-phosphate guanylyltransferase [Rhodobacterales bacterium]
MDLTLILGGIASGKSAFAETVVTRAGLPRVYLATAQAFDDEMRAKLDRHRARRGPDWQTIEDPLDAAARLSEMTPGRIVLLDCATMWLSNHMLADSDVEKERARLLSALAQCPAPVVVVSNEIGLSGIAENALARRFANEQGRLNQSLAEQASRVTFVAAGLPLALKGPLP